MILMTLLHFITVVVIISVVMTIITFSRSRLVGHLILGDWGEKGYRCPGREALGCFLSCGILLQTIEGFRRYSRIRCIRWRDDI